MTVHHFHAFAGQEAHWVHVHHLHEPFLLGEVTYHCQKTGSNPLQARELLKHLVAAHWVDNSMPCLKEHVKLDFSFPYVDNALYGFILDGWFPFLQVLYTTALLPADQRGVRYAWLHGKLI